MKKNILGISIMPAPVLPTSNTRTDTNYDISVDANGALLLDGNLSMTTNINDVAGLDDTILMAQNDAERFTTIKTLTPTFYIRQTHDINSHIQLHAGNDDGNNGIGGGNDDAWSMTQIKVNDVVASGEVRLLPTGSQAIKVGTVRTVALNGQNDDFTLTMDLSLANDGALTASADFDQQTFRAKADEDVSLAQYAYWPVNGATGSDIKANDVDTLVASLTNDDLDTHYNDQIADILNDYNGFNVVTSYEITFDAVAADPKSNLSAWAQNQTDVDLPTNDPFTTGDKIVAATHYTYSITLSNLDSATVVMANDYVFGILQQS